MALRAPCTESKRNHCSPQLLQMNTVWFNNAITDGNHTVLKTNRKHGFLKRRKVGFVSFLYSSCLWLWHCGLCHFVSVELWCHFSYFVALDALRMWFELIGMQPYTYIKIINQSLKPQNNAHTSKDQRASSTYSIFSIDLGHVNKNLLYCEFKVQTFLKYEPTLVLHLGGRLC